MIQLDQVDARIREHSQSVLERDCLGISFTLGRLMGAGVIDQDAAHHAGGDSQEVRAILPVDRALVYQPHIRLVHQCGGL